MGLLDKLGLTIPSPQTQEEKEFLEKLSIFVMKNLGKVSSLKLRDFGYIPETKGIFFTMEGDNDLLEKWLTLFPEHREKIEGFKK